MSVPYPLAGTRNSAVRAGVVEVDGGSVQWLRIPGDPREHYIARLQWLDASTVLLQQLNRLQNTDAYLLADGATGNVRRLWEDRDDAFITIGFRGLPEAIAIRNGAELLVLSERDGWMHVYRLTRDGRATLVTRGDIDVAEISGVDEKGGWVYFIASPENPTQRYLYRSPLDGRSDPVRITPARFAGTNGYAVSPDGRYAFHTFSSFDDPGVHEIVRLPGHESVRPMGDSSNLRATLAPMLTPPVEFFKTDAGGGVTVDGYMIRPPSLDPARKYPVLVHIYGEPAAQTVADEWDGPGTLFHRYLASLGYIVVSFDNAGTPALRGRSWRKAIYGDVGVLSSEQQAQALRSFARARPFVDLDPVAVWGWSGGGTNTHNQQLRPPAHN
jgi:dipeptidyl-peptidase-4